MHALAPAIKLEAHVAHTCQGHHFGNAIQACVVQGFPAQVPCRQRSELEALLRRHARGRWPCQLWRRVPIQSASAPQSALCQGELQSKTSRLLSQLCVKCLESAMVQHLPRPVPVQHVSAVQPPLRHVPQATRQTVIFKSSRQFLHCPLNFSRAPGDHISICGAASLARNVVQACAVQGLCAEAPRRQPSITPSASLGPRRIGAQWAYWGP